MTEHTTEIPVPPCPKPRMTRSDKWKTDPDHPNPLKRKRPAVTRYHEFKDDLAKVIHGELEPRFTVVFQIAMPASWTAKKKALFDGKPHQVKPDVDNYLKAFMDALCTDDSYVFDAHALKYWAKEGKIILTERVYDE